MSIERLQRVLEQIDQLNREDPTRETAGGVSQPLEILYAQWLTGWVIRLQPQASEPLRIAARGQHVQRWTIPRERYERNRKGYLRWRETLKAFHAQTVAGAMQEAGYPDEMIERVRRLILKKDLSDPDTQTIEDALCLVFLEHQFEDLRRKTPDATMRDVLRKTWKKMSPQARELADGLALPAETKAWLADALRPG
jgi:hypothetical protein